MDFLKANAGKLVLAAIFLIVATVMFTKFGGSQGPQRSSKVHFVCVETGEFFWLPREPRSLPEMNPNTNKRTLLPCYDREDGKTALSGRMMGYLADLDKEGLNHFVDGKTLEVKSVD